jgi:hypothetical protein
MTPTGAPQPRALVRNTGGGTATRILAAVRGAVRTRDRRVQARSQIGHPVLTPHNRGRLALPGAQLTQQPGGSPLPKGPLTGDPLRSGLGACPQRTAGTKLVAVPLLEGFGPWTFTARAGRRSHSTVGRLQEWVGPAMDSDYAS